MWKFYEFPYLVYDDVIPNKKGLTTKKLEMCLETSIIRLEFSFH